VGSHRRESAPAAVFEEMKEMSAPVPHRGWLVRAAL